MGYLPRKHARHTTEKLPVTLRQFGTFVWSRGSVLNLSAGGVQIYTASKLTTGSKLEIEFNTVDKSGRRNRRKMLVLIVWKSGFKYGCKFVGSK